MTCPTPLKLATTFTSAKGLNMKNNAFASLTDDELTKMQDLMAEMLVISDEFAPDFYEMIVDKYAEIVREQTDRICDDSEYTTWYNSQEIY